MLGNVAAYLWQQNQLDHLTALLQRAAPLITGQYHMDQRVGTIMPQVGDDAPWPIELRYNRPLDEGRLRYEWRITAARLADTWGIPAPATLKLKRDINVPEDDLVLIVGELKTPSIEVPALPSSVAVSEEDMPEPLQPWFRAHREQWVRVDVLEEDGPWWLVPHWTQPLFVAAGHPASPKEAVVAMAVGEALTKQPELALNPRNVGYLLRRLEDAGYKHTVAEALASRGGIDGLVEDLCAIVSRRYPLVNLEYVLDSLAGYPRSQFSPADVAEYVQNDQTAATSRLRASLVGAHGAAPAEVAELFRAEDIGPYLDTAGRIGSQPPLRVYLGDELLFYLAPRENKFLEQLEDLRGELFKRFGIIVPPVKWRASNSDPTGKLPPNAFRIEVLTQTWLDEDTDAIDVAISEGGAEQVLLEELRRRLLAWRTWWITADYVDKQLEQNKPLKAWLLNRYTLTDIKSLLRGVLAPTDAELDAYRAKSIESALRQAAPEQSVRESDWLLGSLVFWSQAGDGLDTGQLVRALQETQAARLAPNGPPSPDKPATGILAGIEALEQRNFGLAEERFRAAVSADRSGAIATFLAAYGNRDSVNTMADKLTQVCLPFEPPGKLNERLSINEQMRFEIEDFLARHQDSIADRDRASLEYCLLEHYAGHAHGNHERASLDLFKTTRYGGQLEPNQKYALGFWTLELSGRSFDQPTDLAAAENWLTSAFQEWKETEQDEASAHSAFLELLNRYNVRSLPRWYPDMLQRLGELHRNNSHIAYALGETLSGSSDEANVKKALFWLERAREQINGPAVAEADRPLLSAWIDWAVARYYSAKARFSSEKARQEAAQEARSRLEALIQNLRNNGFIRDKKWPGGQAYATLIETHQFHKEFEEAAKVLGDSRDDGLTEESPDLVANRFTLLLAVGRIHEAFQLAERALKMPDFERADALFLAALSQLVTDQRDAEQAAREYLLTTKHDYRDYIRLMLYWYLARRGKLDQAKAYLEERWRGINPASWPARLGQGDTQVWRERLIGYYLGSVPRDEIFTPLRSPEAFEASGLSRIGLEYEDMYCEAYFYHALLQAVTGDPATRSARFAQAIQDVLEKGRGNYFEYLMALYLRPQAGSR